MRNRKINDALRRTLKCLQKRKKKLEPANKKLIARADSYAEKERDN